MKIEHYFSALIRKAYSTLAAEDEEEYLIQLTEFRKIYGAFLKKEGSQEEAVSKIECIGAEVICKLQKDDEDKAETAYKRTSELLNLIKG